MKIGGNPSSVRNLVPLSEYTGAILKLTQKDKKEIAKLQKELVALEIKHYDMQKHIDHAKYVSENFWQDLYGVAQCIESIKAQIKEIKINRLSEQNAKKERAKKLELIA